ncbi:MAG: vanw family protein [Sphingomonas bacterium]|uniref:VanW family protein n=1 Tax=Sphingomonas bacterium TaxID=1895847 RepID=UPI00262878A8|nr:VanW family protein [Sphingomonas bacterium]MDB5707579.1 vanw family protein [Sphingomonas bacterium]
MSDRLATAATMPKAGVPTRASALVFAAKATLLRARRGAQDVTPGLAPIRHLRRAALTDAPVLATVRTPLWTSAGGEKDRALNAGKIQNLRSALRGIDGIEVEAGRTLSFWRQVGRPTRGRGFVAGRELREGCMIATIGGGLCQLSNALYDAGLQAGLEIVERHAHTRIVPGSRAAAGRDATVFWNYLDLRMRGRRPFRIEARLTVDELELTIRGYGAGIEAPAPHLRTGLAAHDCLSCGQVTCHKHNPDTEAAVLPTAWLVDMATPEFTALFKERAKPGDVLHLSTRRFGASAGAWPSLAEERTADLAALRRALALRIAPAKAPRAGLMLAADARLAAAHARRLSVDHTHLVVAQALLPHLWQAGALQGRSFEVLMDRLPIEALHRILDEARARYPESPTLGDFRAPPAIAAAEREALGAATGLITAHHAVAAHFPAGRVDLLDWAPAPPLMAKRSGSTFLFAGPALARKGTHAMREAMAGLDMALLIERAAEEAPDFWAGLDVRRLGPGEQPAELAGIVLPAIVEQRPHLLLRGLAAGLPVIATAACGLAPQPGLTLVEPDDPVALRSALIAALG